MWLRLQDIRKKERVMRVIPLGKWIAKHKRLILLAGFLLLIPSFLGMAATRVNYDLLSYLPESLETVRGQDILVDEYGMGAFSMVVVEDMELKDVKKLEDAFSKVAHVKDVLWYDDVADLSLPVEMLPKDLREAFFRKNATMMLVLFDNTTSSDEAMNAVADMRNLAGTQCFISGMSGIVNDIKDIALKELPVYVVIAAGLSFLVLELTTESFLVPVFFLLSIGTAIVYNLGSNVFLGQVSYITKALTAVLQLGVTMDYSIFLLNSFEENKRRFPKDKVTAMGYAISNTFRSIVGSSVTTIAGFAALCFMTFALGKDLGIVMAKGVIIGVLCCVTILPALILTFDRQIERTGHRPLIQSVDRVSGFFIRHYRLWTGIFLILLLPAAYGNGHTEVYYDIARSLPASLPGNVAAEKLEEDFDMNTVYMIMTDKNMEAKEKAALMEEIGQVDGVTWCISMRSLAGPMVPENMIPKEIKSMLQSGDTELMFLCSSCDAATPEANRQIAAVSQIAKSHDPSSMVIGEAPLMRDLENVTSVDIRNVNLASVIAIFVIILLVFKSLSLPVILVAVIEFAIAVNMAVPFYQHTSLPFVASIVIGTIQLGATVDYAIVMTSRYIRERKDGKDKKEAVRIAHKTNMLSIITSALSLFAATYGVALYSKVDMIGAICTLLARGAIISMLVVVTLLPAMFLIFDKVICRTTIGMGRRMENAK